MKTISVLLILFSHNLVHASYFMPNDTNIDQVLEVMHLDHIDGVKYLGKTRYDNVMVSPVDFIQVPLIDGTWESKKKFTVYIPKSNNDDFARLLVCKGPVMTKKHHKFVSPFSNWRYYESWLNAVMTYNNDSRETGFQIVLLGCSQYPADGSKIGGGYGGSYIFEIDSAGSIIKTFDY